MWKSICKLSFPAVHPILFLAYFYARLPTAFKFASLSFMALKDFLKQSANWLETPLIAFLVSYPLVFIAEFTPLNPWQSVCCTLAVVLAMLLFTPLINCACAYNPSHRPLFIASPFLSREEIPLSICLCNVAKSLAKT